MRYLINMDYSFDLNINTMGRRIRTRLYFSSESHLHTILNVLRFTKSEKIRSLLSEDGIAKLNATPELCYLTQFVMRVFEDSRRDMSDPKRFRVEMLFSPGATATPFHMNEMDRDADASRFDTAPFENIGRDDLTCQDVEDFFDWAIQAGRSNNDDDVDVDEEKSVTMVEPTKGLLTPTSSPVKRNGLSADRLNANIEEQASITSRKSDTVDEGEKAIPAGVITKDPRQSSALTTRDLLVADSGSGNVSNIMDGTLDISENPDAGTVTRSKDDDKGRDDAPGDVSRKYYWSCVAIGCFTVGVAFLGAALHLSHGTRRRRY